MGPRFRGDDSKKSPIQFRIMPENAALVERQPPCRCDIGLDARAFGDAIMHADHGGDFALDAGHRLREGIAQALDQLEQREIDVRKLASEQIRPAALLQRGLEIAEIFRHALGEKTFGKGVVQELENLDAGSSLKLTVARWFTPAGINISLKGIEPDIKVELTDDQKKNIIFGDLSVDPQLQKALDVLK